MFALEGGLTNGLGVWTGCYSSSDAKTRSLIRLRLVLVVPQVDTFPVSCYHIVCIQEHLSVAPLGEISVTAMFKHLQVALGQIVAPAWLKKRGH